MTLYLFCLGMMREGLEPEWHSGTLAAVHMELERERKEFRERNSVAEHHEAVKIGAVIVAGSIPAVSKQYGQCISGSLAEGECDGSANRNRVICPQGNSLEGNSGETNGTDGQSDKALEESSAGATTLQQSARTMSSRQAIAVSVTSASESSKNGSAESMRKIIRNFSSNELENFLPGEFEEPV